MKWIERHLTDHIPTYSQIKNCDFELAIPDFKPTICNYELVNPKQRSPSSNSKLQFVTDSSCDTPEVGTREFKVSGHEPKSFKSLGYVQKFE